VDASRPFPYRTVLDKPTQLNSYFDLTTRTGPVVPAGSVMWGDGGGYLLLCPPQPSSPGDGGFTVDFYYVGTLS
jgi:hypothetical protein